MMQTPDEIVDQVIEAGFGAGTEYAEANDYGESGLTLALVQDEMNGDWIKGLMREAVEADRAQHTGSRGFSWFDFEEDRSTDDIADRYILTIEDAAHNEIAVIVHRTVGGAFPLDGDIANRKRANAQMIVNALNAQAEGTA